MNSASGKKIRTKATDGQISIEAMKTTEMNNKNFKTHSLRIGGHTFFITYGMPEDFVNFLGRRKVSKTSQLWYRASARLTLQKFRRFAKNTKGFKARDYN